MALQVWKAAGGGRIRDALYDEIFNPVAGRLLKFVGAVLRLPGTSTGADNHVRLANKRRIAVYYRLEDVPDYSSGGGS